MVIKQTWKRERRSCLELYLAVKVTAAAMEAIAAMGASVWRNIVATPVTVPTHHMKGLSARKVW